MDRWFLSPGAPDDDVSLTPSNRKATAARVERASARRPAPAAAPAAPKVAPPAPAAGKASAPPVSNVATRLQEAARNQGQPLDLERVKDAFRPSAVFLPVREQVVVVPVTEPAPAPVPARDEVAEFLGAHKLQAVMKRASGGVAIVDKKTVLVGQSFGGFRLVAVKDRSAVFRRGSLRAELRLPDDVVAGEILPSGTSEKFVGTEVTE